MTASAPFARGSISFRSYPNDEQDATALVDEMCHQAAFAVHHGFDGIMTSEHHGGFAGYVPNPLQFAGFALDEMDRGWAAPCPLLLPLRPPVLVAEEIAWLAARHPGRVGLGVAAGARPGDFALMDTTMDGLAARFASGLGLVTRLLRGEDERGLRSDPAIARCAEHPIPVLSAAASMTAARRAARAGAGLLFDSLVTPVRVRALVEAYRNAGGAGACVLVRRAWLGDAPAENIERQVGVYREYAPDGASAHWGEAELAAGTSAAEVAGRLAGALHVAGADALNIRVHAPGVSAPTVRGQIACIGDEVLPRLREMLAT